MRETADIAKTRQDNPDVAVWANEGGSGGKVIR